jgi:hypothetical protein
MLRHQNVLDADIVFVEQVVASLVLPHVTVKNVEEFFVNGVEIRADNDGRFVSLDGHNVDDLVEHGLPHVFGIAAHHGNVDFVVNVADFVSIRRLVGIGRHFSVVFQFRGTEWTYPPEDLRVFAASCRAIKQLVWHITHLVHSGGRNFRMVIVGIRRFTIFFEMSFIILHCILE